MFKWLSNRNLNNTIEFNIVQSERVDLTSKGAVSKDLERQLKMQNVKAAIIDKTLSLWMIPAITLMIFLYFGSFKLLSIIMIVLLCANSVIFTLLSKKAIEESYNIFAKAISDAYFEEKPLKWLSKMETYKGIESTNFTKKYALIYKNSLIGSITIFIILSILYLL